METLLKLGIDWQSMIIYLVNFGVLFFLVSKYVVPKVLHYLDERTNTIQNSIEEANRLKNEFQTKLAEIQKEKEEAKIQLLNEIEEVKKTLNTQKKELTESMENERREMLEKAQKEINERQDMLMKEVEDRMLEVVKKMVLFVVQNKLPEDVVTQSVNDAWKEYKK